MFFIAGRHGFVAADNWCMFDIRWAMSFTSFNEADEYAKTHSAMIGPYYAILTATIPEAA